MAFWGPKPYLSSHEERGKPGVLQLPEARRHCTPTETMPLRLIWRMTLDSTSLVMMPDLFVTQVVANLCGYKLCCSIGKEWVEDYLHMSIIRHMPVFLHKK